MNNKKALYKKWMSMLLAGVVTTSGFMGGTATVQAAETTKWVSDQEVKGTAEAPKPDEVLPDANQFRYQKEELAAFCHFGPNTFNEIEWGEHYGDKKPSEIFRLKEDFDAETMVKTLKDAGFKKLIVTAKHHDGFCIWDSAHTDYDVKEAGYKNAEGESDILAEISAACTKENMDMGLYLSPWDIHEPSYGYKDAQGHPTTPENDEKDYNDFYNNQLEEILGNEKYGNKGHFVEVWMDGAKGSGANAQEYDFQRWFKTIQKHEGKDAGFDADCMLFGAEAYTTVRWIGNELGIAGKDTWSKSNVDKNKNTIDSNKQGNATVGFEDGNQWTVPEADARITSGWFWGTKKNAPKTMEELSDMYFNSVGHNAPLLLNVPPNDKGKVDDAILNRVKEFGENINKTFKTNLAKEEGASVKVSSVRGNAETFKPGNMLDNDDQTYWTTDDGTKSGEILIDLGKEKKFDIVSVEEAIQNGQRINKYKVEYRKGESGDWTLLEQGTTIGAKRLCRTNETSARQIKITVETKDGKVPMINEVGVYKSTPDMEKPNPIPKGMEIIDITDNDLKDGKGFQFKGTWNGEEGPQYINGTNKWANAGAELELKFAGTKAYLFGTVDPGHGTIEVSVDSGKKVTVDTKAGTRAVGQKLFETADLDDKEHTIKVKVTGKALGIEAAAAINNGGKGMIELESNAYTMDEDETKSLKIKRVGGTKGEIKAKLQPNPGTAIQDDYDTALIPEITLKDGESETTADVRTRRNTNKTGDQYFTAELTADSEDVMLGFNKKAKITIRDMESSDKILDNLVKECNSYKKDWFIAGWDSFETALNKAKAVLEKQGASQEEKVEAAKVLETAKNELQKREKYTAEDPFVFPWREDASATLEAEFSDLHNTGGDGEKWKLTVSEEKWASNKKFVNCLNAGDTITIPYKVEKPGTYNVKLTYRSGSPTNSLAWEDSAGNIKAGNTVAGNDKSDVTKTVTFDIVAEKAGEGVLTLKGHTKDAPQLDMFEITPGSDIKREQFTVTASVEGEGGTITPDGATKVTEGNDVTFQIKADKTHKIADVLVNGESVGAVGFYTVKDVKKDTTIVAKFVSSSYTEDNRFNFPTELNGAAVTAEAEHFELKNKDENNEKWKMEIKEADWASNGWFVNSMNNGDQIILPYHAEKAGKYKATVQFRSGDPNNGLTWAEADNKIASQEEVVKVGAGDQANATHTQEIEFVVNEAGNGRLVFTAPEKNAPQLDKFDITFIEEKAPAPTPTPEADMSALNAVLAEATEKMKEADSFTEETVSALKEAMEAAQNVLDTPNVKQEEVDAATSAVRTAIDSLQKKPVEQTEFTIKAAAYGGGNIDPSGAVKVEKGKEQTFTIQPNEGFDVKDVLVNEESVGPVTEYKFEAVQADASIEVFFVENGEGQADKSKLSECITAAEELLKHAEDYAETDIQNLQGALEAAKTVVNDEKAIQEQVDAAHKALEKAMSITPIQKEFVIQAEAGEGGSITPAGIVKVERGNSQTFTIQPEKDYVISDVLVNGESQGAITEYTFKDVLVNGQSGEKAGTYAADEVKVDAKITAVFKKEVVTVDKAELTNVVAEAEGKLAESEKYTDETVKALQSALEEARAVLADELVDQVAVDAATQKVRSAINGLKEKPQPEKPQPEGQGNAGDGNTGNGNTGNGNTGNGNTGNGTTGNNTTGGQNSGANNQSTTQKPSFNTSDKAVQTGDATSVFGSISGILAGGAAILAILRKRAK